VGSFLGELIGLITQHQYIFFGGPGPGLL
jgi:hypothetical protein